MNPDERRTELEPYVPLCPCKFLPDSSDVRLFVLELSGEPELEQLYQVACVGCGAEGPIRDDPFSAVDLWNAVNG